MKKVKKLTVLILSVMLSISFTNTVFAQENQNIRENQGVSYAKPVDKFNSGIYLYSDSRPSADTIWNIAKKGRYDFSGWSYGDVLYTNYRFKGKNKYKIYVKNTGDHTLTVKAKDFWNTYASVKVSSGKEATIEFSGVSKSTDFYLTFESKSGIVHYGYSFEGYIK